MALTQGASPSGHGQMAGAPGWRTGRGPAPSEGTSGGGGPRGCSTATPRARDQGEMPAFQHRPLAAEASRKAAARLLPVQCVLWGLPGAPGSELTPGTAGLGPGQDASGCRAANRLCGGKARPSQRGGLASPHPPLSPHPLRPRAVITGGSWLPSTPPGLGAPQVQPTAWHTGVSAACGGYTHVRLGWVPEAGRPPLRPFALPRAHHRAKATAAAPKGLGAAEGVAV